MKTVVATGFAFFVLACTVLARGSGAIDLNVPGNLEAVERANPEHYAKIQRILAEIPQRPPAERSVASWMRTEFEARDIRYTDLVMTSLPPKKRLAFSLDDTAYVAVVTLTGWGAELRRVKQATEQSREPAAIR
ncbi:MAG TPA: hypothetical protein VMQ50_14310 [Casimicrobiaceae bacterium]|nr:hypothetical protein [Casimicrobiaceae bacterium]